MTPLSSSRWQKENLGYCTNVHPGERYNDVKNNLQKFVYQVKLLRGLDSMSSALWLSAHCAQELVDTPQTLNDFSGFLRNSGLNITSLNGFPYGNFHARVVKSQVYSPDWSTPERLLYTLNLVTILTHILPCGVMEGWISTLPLGYRGSWRSEQNDHAIQNLCSLVQTLEKVWQTSGKTIGICLEMEPGCVLENCQDAIDFHHKIEHRAMSEFGIEPSILNRHLGICLDICHQTVIFEAPDRSMERLTGAGITIGKIQVSSALNVTNPADPSTRLELENFAEPRYLHQTWATPYGGEQPHHVMDLDEALSNPSFPIDRPWHVHFHTPISEQEMSLTTLKTTRQDILKTLDFIKSHPDINPLIEVETYTWNVLPEKIRPATDQALIQALAKELSWLETAMLERDLIKA